MTNVVKKVGLYRLKAYEGIQYSPHAIRFICQIKSTTIYDDGINFTDMRQT